MALANGIEDGKDKIQVTQNLLNKFCRRLARNSLVNYIDTIKFFNNNKCPVPSKGGFVFVRLYLNMGRMWMGCGFGGGGGKRGCDREG